MGSTIPSRPPLQQTQPNQPTTRTGPPTGMPNPDAAPIQPSAPPNQISTEEINNVTNIENVDWEPAQNIMPEGTQHGTHVEGEVWIPPQNQIQINPEDFISVLELPSLEEAQAAMAEAIQNLNNAAASGNPQTIAEASNALAAAQEDIKAAAEELRRDNTTTVADYADTVGKFNQAVQAHSNAVTAVAQAAAKDPADPAALAKAQAQLAKATEDLEYASQELSDSANALEDGEAIGQVMNQESVEQYTEDVPALASPRTNDNSKAYTADMRERLVAAFDVSPPKPENMTPEQEEAWSNRMEAFAQRLENDPKIMDRLVDLMESGNMESIVDNAALIFWGRGGC